MFYFAVKSSRLINEPVEKLLGKRDSQQEISRLLTIGANWPHSFFRAAAPNDPHHFWNKGKGDGGGVFLFAFSETGDFIIGRIDLTTYEQLDFFFSFDSTCKFCN